jgi:putative heme-binding domain-containing protein
VKSFLSNCRIAAFGVFALLVLPLGGSAQVAGQGEPGEDSPPPQEGAPSQQAIRAEDYDQWKLALGADAALEAESLEIVEGFEVDLLRSATQEEGSWISLAFDPLGRFLIGREDKGILRITPPNEEMIEPLVETVNDTLEECRGLLWAYDALYVNANNSKGFYRLRDSTGDDQFDEVTLLRATGGGVGHGRNDLALGPDGMLYLVHGNDTLLPADYDRATSPLAQFREDKLLPCTWDRLLFNAGVRAPGGHIIRTDRDGKKWELFAGGFRNPYGLDFNADGELFTYDADMEWDAGAPWYRPTRVNHVISGADFGWRQGTGKWPEFYPDSLPAVVNIGLGSPTGVKFGTRSNFPEKYRRALFIQDWAYGRIHAVHLEPSGAGYTGTAELFLSGKPLNVTDLDFGPDGAMYFVTGGRSTQSGLYRVRYVPPEGEAVEESVPPSAESPLSNEESPKDEMPRGQEAPGEVPPVEPPAAEVPATQQPLTEAEALGQLTRNTRHELERFHDEPNAAAVDAVWEYLQSPDPWIRYAARVALEHQPAGDWQDRALAETHPTAAATALLALSRTGTRLVQPKLLEKADALLSGEVALATEQKLIVLRALVVSFCRMFRPFDREAEAQITRRLESIYPDESLEVNHLLCQLLVYLESPQVVEKTLPLLDAAATQEEKLHYLFTLRHVRSGWTIEQRAHYFQALRLAHEFRGAHYMPRFLEYIQDDAVATLTGDELAKLAPLLDVKDEQPADDNTLESVERPFVRKWSADDLTGDLEQIAHSRDFQRGKDLFAAISCSRCHRLGDVGQPVGPDLMEVARRFSRRDMLVSLIEPSKAIDEKYRHEAIVTGDGRVVVGRVIGDDGTTMIVEPDPFDAKRTVDIAIKEIEVRQPSPVSPMPASLLDTLSRDEILDLLAYLESGGDPAAANFQPPDEPDGQP